MILNPFPISVAGTSGSSAPIRVTGTVLIQLLEISPDALVVVDQTGTIVMVNEQLAALFGSRRQELQGQWFEVLLPERFHAVNVGHREHYFAAPCTRPMGGRTLLFGRRKDGTEFPVDISLRPLLLNEQPLVIGAIRDMTEQRHRLEQAEQAKHAETIARLALLQQIFDALPCSVYLVYGYDARLMLANRAATSVWGAEWQAHQPMLEFLTSNGISIFNAQGHPLAPEQFATLRAVQKGETAPLQQETIRHPDGSTLPVLVNAVTLTPTQSWSMLQHGTGQQVHPAEPVALVVHQDMTALKEDEYFKDEFVGIVAHELRTPLTVLKGFANILLMRTERGCGPALAPWQKEALEDIELATVRLVDLTEGLLDVTRLQAGRFLLHRTPTNLIPLVQRVTTHLQQMTTQHQFEVRTTHLALLADIDASRIEQVLTNLIGNAIKYSPQGGHVIITIWEETTAHIVGMSVQDIGIGIPKHQHAQIFGRFMRADNARAWGIRGTGLGLYLCRRLVEQHEGQLWFESEEGVGSTFFLTLPLVSAHQESSEP